MMPDARTEYAEGSRIGGGLTIRGSNVNTLYQQVLAYVIGLGRSASPRGIGTVELKATTLVLENSRRNVLTIPERNLNYVFSVAEWLWILLGRSDVQSIAHFNSQIARFSDDGKTLRGAYGAYLLEHKQLRYAIETLRRDPDSRQAVITMWRPSPQPSKDIPCTLNIQFILRKEKLAKNVYEDRLHAWVTMRSNDVWLGLPYDIFNFTQLQAYVAAELDVFPGEYYHTVGSLHLYESNREQAYFVKQAPVTISPESPLLTPLGEDRFALATAFDVAASGNATGWTPEVHEPWQGYLDVLQYKNRKDVGQVKLEPYRSLLRAREEKR